MAVGLIVLALVVFAWRRVVVPGKGKLGEMLLLRAGAEGESAGLLNTPGIAKTEVWTKAKQVQETELNASSFGVLSAEEQL